MNVVKADLVAAMAQKRKRLKKKHRDEDDVDRLRQENRQLKSIVRSLTKQLKKASKGVHRLSDLEEMMEHDSPEEKKEIKGHGCPTCKQGKLERVKIVGREFDRCRECGWRSKAQKTQETD